MDITKLKIRAKSNVKLISDKSSKYDFTSPANTDFMGFMETLIILAVFHGYGQQIKDIVDKKMIEVDKLHGEEPQAPNKANPEDMRQVLEVVNTFKKAGLLFVPIPVMDTKHHQQLLTQSKNTLEIMQKLADLRESTC